MGNVGLHYYDWRYGATATPRQAQVLAATAPAEVCSPAGGNACPFTPAVPSTSQVPPGGPGAHRRGRQHGPANPDHADPAAR